jgi:valyl-tRNA synthetase
MFCNKMWQATRFGLMKLSPGFKRIEPVVPASKPDAWILSRLAFAIAESNAGFETYDFNRATTAIYNFWLYDFCDTYIEWVKPNLSKNTAADKQAKTENVLCACLDGGLRLISP